MLQRSRCRKCPHPCLVLIKLYEIYLGFWVGHSLYATEVTMREQASEGVPHEDCGTMFLFYLPFPKPPWPLSLETTRCCGGKTIPDDRE